VEAAAEEAAAEEDAAEEDFAEDFLRGLVWCGVRWRVCG